MTGSYNILISPGEYVCIRSTPDADALYYSPLLHQIQGSSGIGDRSAVFD
jgi:hypothetical protein